MTPHELRAGIIIKIGMNHFGISVDEIESHTRKPPLPDYRQAIMRAVYRSGLSSIATGQLFRRDHANVLHAAKVIPKKIAKGDLLARDLAEFDRLTAHLTNS